MLKYDKIFFLHVPKTAGTSFNSIFKPLFAPDRYFDHMESRPDLFWSVQNDGLPFFLSGHLYFDYVRPLIDKADIFTTTILREPIAQLISHLKWVKYVGSPKYPDPAAIDSEILEFSRELFQVPLNDVARIGSLLDHPVGLRLFDNLQVRYMSDPFVPQVGLEQRKKAIENIAMFRFLFALEDLEVALKDLSRKLPGVAGISSHNVAQIEDDIDLHDADVVNFYLEKTEFDQDLYLYARSFSQEFHLSEAVDVTC